MKLQISDILWNFLSLNLVKYKIFFIWTWDRSLCLWIITFQMKKTCVYQVPTSFFDFKGKTHFVIYVFTTFLWILILMWLFCRKQFTLLHNENDPRVSNVSGIGQDFQLSFPRRFVQEEFVRDANWTPFKDNFFLKLTSNKYRPTIIALVGNKNIPWNVEIHACELVGPS